MTRSERQSRERVWLRIRRFAITNTLKSKLPQAKWLNDRQQEWICYIQNKVLRETERNPAYWANIGAKYWEDKIGGGYRRWIGLLVDWGELEVNNRYRTGAPGTTRFTMSYRVPFNALDGGKTKIDFNRRATPIKDRTNMEQADDIVRHVHKCSSLLTMPKSLVEIPDPVFDAAAHEFSRRIYYGDFNIRYGETGGRLFHSIIEMPKVARANLVFKTGNRPLYEYDIKSCHPVLLLPLFSDPQERAKYALVLDNDVYTTIQNVMGVAEDRDGVKIAFMVCTNSIDRYVAARRGFVYQFFKTHFPVFTHDVLDLRSDLAAYLQRQESQIMVKQLGRYCTDRNIFWIPCHDGWMGTDEGEDEIVENVRRAFSGATGYPVRIMKTKLGGGTVDITTNSINRESRVSGEYGSYVRIEGTIPPSDHKKSAEEWYASLPKNPDFDPETLRLRAQSRKTRTLASRDHRRRAIKVERLRRGLYPVWRRLMCGSDSPEAETERNT